MPLQSWHLLIESVTFRSDRLVTGCYGPSSPQVGIAFHDGTLGGDARCSLMQSRAAPRRDCELRAALPAGITSWHEGIMSDCTFAAVAVFIQELMWDLNGLILCGGSQRQSLPLNQRRASLASTQAAIIAPTHFSTLDRPASGSLAELPPCTGAVSGPAGAGSSGGIACAPLLFGGRIAGGCAAVGMAAAGLAGAGGASAEITGLAGGVETSGCSTGGSGVCGSGRSSAMPSSPWHLGRVGGAARQLSESSSGGAPGSSHVMSGFSLRAATLASVAFWLSTNQAMALSSLKEAVMSPLNTFRPYAFRSASSVSSLAFCVLRASLCAASHTHIRNARELENSEPSRHRICHCCCISADRTANATTSARLSLQMKQFRNCWESTLQPAGVLSF